MSIRLGVNIDHVATLRQVRGRTTPYPSILGATLDAVKGGLDVVKNQKRISKLIDKLKKKDIETSLFIGGDIKQVRASKEVGGFAVEFHTGHWVDDWRNGKKSADKHWKRLLEAAYEAQSLELLVHAGHGSISKRPLGK